MHSVYEGFKAHRATEFDDNVETLLQTEQQKFDRHMRKVTALSYEVEQSRTNGGVPSEDKVKELQAELDDHVYPIIVSLQALQQKYETQTNVSRDKFNQNDELWKTTTEMEDTQAHIQEEKQKLESVKALSTQSLELYRHQNNVMWLNIGLFVLLVAGAAYLYYYVHSMSTGEHSLTHLPENPKELLDNDYVKYNDILPTEEPNDEYEKEVATNDADGSSDDSSLEDSERNE